MEKRPLNINTVLELANDKDIKSFDFFGDRIIYHGHVDQYISMASEEDLVLIENSKSFLSFLQRECMQIRVHCTKGETFKSRIIKGSKSHVSNYKEIKNIAYDLILSARRSGHDIDYIEIAHTHLGEQYAYIGDSGKVQKVYSKGLSKADVGAVKLIRPFLNYKIVMKSISESEIAYNIQI